MTLPTLGIDISSLHVKCAYLCLLNLLFCIALNATFLSLSQNGRRPVVNACIIWYILLINLVHL